MDECPNCHDANLRADAFKRAWIANRQDVPRVGLFNHWSDAIAAASRRAALTGYRQHVKFEPNNAWWTIVEHGRLAWWHDMRATA